MAVITISRQYGSGGEEIAQRVCDVLGYTYFDKNMLVQVASEMGLSEEQVVDFYEDTYKMRSFVERLIGSRRVKVETWQKDQKTGTKTLHVDSLNEEQGVKLVRDTILATYEHGNVVIVGRGGQVILKEHPGVLHVRIMAPLGARALRIKERDKLTLGEATDRAKQKDQAATTYLSKFFEIDWDNPLLYHLVLNTGRWELDAAADIVINSLSRLPTVSRGLM